MRPCPRHAQFQFPGTAGMAAHVRARFRSHFRVCFGQLFVRDFPMRSRTSESFIVLPLLPIFLLGAFPMLLLSLMGPSGLVILGILIASVGLTDVLESNSA